MAALLGPPGFTDLGEPARGSAWRLRRLTRVLTSLSAVPEPRRFFLRTFGCQMNEHDSERIAGLLQADGLEEAPRAEDADIVVLNTCCIRENADNKLYGSLGHLKSLKDRNPTLQIAVAGCLAQKDRDTVTAKAPHVDVVLGTHNVHRVAELLHEAEAAGHSIVEILEEAVADDLDTFPSALPVRREVPWAGWVTIQIGCDNTCAFCIVPAVRGREISRPFDHVVDEVRRAADDGVTEVTLLGQNVNSYGRDLTLAARQAGGTERVRPLFAELLRAVGGVEGIERVRYTSPHPKDLRPETIAAMAETASVCEHLHLPLQSGSDRVLAEMHRGYTAERYLERLAAARAAIDDLAVTTDIIVGFPGETDDDFARTLEVAAAAAYDSAYTFIYSPRPGTEAAERVDDLVAPEVVGERFERLRVVVERSSLAKHERRVGRIEEVLVEGPSRKDREVLTGRTRQNKLVHFEARTIRPGTYALVHITRAAPHHLRGELVEVTRPAAHKTRLPLLVG
jgi:tRNA-2-methylthio-N6-dimethylallyladenosine synthase